MTRLLPYAAVALLAAAGVRAAFGVVGSGNFHVTNALVARGVRYHAARHEGGAATMADAYARMTGEVTVLSVHQGPGLTNAITGIAEATFARALSGSVPQRAATRGVLPGHAGEWAVENRPGFIDDVRRALYASKVVAYSQGFDQIAAASREYGWDIDRGAMARIWRGGCIIRARFLNRIVEAYERNPELPTLLADEYFAKIVADGEYLGDKSHGRYLARGTNQYVH